MDRLINLLEESSDLYKNFLELEYKKYETVIKNDIDTLNNIVANEQVYYLKMRGIEQKREKLIDLLGYKDMTLNEIVDDYNGIEKSSLKENYDELKKIIIEVKKISDLCKTLIEVRMNRIDKVLEQLGEKENTYSGKKQNNKTKSLVLSKKI